MACREVRERHLVGSADFGFDVVNLAGETVWRKPLGHCCSVEKSPIHALRSRTEHAMKSDSACGHDQFAFRSTVGWELLSFTEPRDNGRYTRVETLSWRPEGSNAVDECVVRTQSISRKVFGASLVRRKHRRVDVA